MSTSNEKYIGESLLKDNPSSRLKLVIADGAVTTDKIADAAVTEDKIADGSVSPEKVSEDFTSTFIMPTLNTLDAKYKNITNELYTMVRSLQVGGVALSNILGSSEEIGITQKSLTELFANILEELSEVTGKEYRTFTLTVSPLLTYTEESVEITVTADCTGSITNFDAVQIFIDDVLMSESSDIYEYTMKYSIDKSVTVKVIGTVAGKEITKTQDVSVQVPFFMGSGSVYTDIMNEECRKELEGTLEGDYDVTVSSDGDYIFIIIPISTKEQFRRADMNGYEIPLTSTEYQEYVVYESSNTYKAGTYNVDININT